MLYALLAGVVVAKLLTALVHWRSFVAHPSRILFSGVGQWAVGGCAALAVGCRLGYRLYRARPAEPVLRQVHPYEIMPSLLWWCGVTGFLGAILFHKLEHWEELAANPWQSLLTIDGLTYYGGLLCGIATALVIAHRHKIPLIHMLDMGSPAMMLAYGIGRLGCHLAGDGDWGIVHTAPMPHWLSFVPSWIWAYQYPQSEAPVFPASLYEAVICLLLFALLWKLRTHITTPGRLFGLYCLLNGTERIFIEQIKTNPVYAFGLSQATLVGLLFIITGFAAFIYTLAPRTFSTRLKTHLS
jgi:prolipoprotein diacylglyceryl transferase